MTLYFWNAQYWKELPPEANEQAAKLRCCVSSLRFLLLRTVIAKTKKGEGSDRPNAKLEISSPTRGDYVSTGIKILTEGTIGNRTRDLSHPKRES